MRPLFSTGKPGINFIGVPLYSLKGVAFRGEKIDAE
jgi:hypothetical protein